MTNDLLAEMPEHETYVEAFGGAGQLLFAKPSQSSLVEVYNDINSDLVALFDLFQDKPAFIEFHKKLKDSLYSREKFYEYRVTWNQQEDHIERIRQWYIVMNQNFGMHIGQRTPSWGYGKNKKSSAKLFKKRVDLLPLMKDRWRDVHIENLDWREILEKYDGKNTLFYLDPPYVIESRVDTRYDHEMTDQDHKELIEKIQELEGKVMLSGYEHPIYEELKWKKKSFNVPCHSASSASTGTRPTRKEILWKNYETQLKLF